MALMDFNVNKLTAGISIANRNDYCYLCATELSAKNDIEYQRKFNALKGKIEGSKVLKFTRSGTETCVCLEHIHALAKDNPIN